MKLTAEESYDQSLKKHRRTYGLDNIRLCFLSFFFTEEWKLEKISFDVEAADDYHYVIAEDQLPKLCAFLSCSNDEASLVDAFSRQLASWKNPIEIAALCEKAQIKYQPYCYY